MKERKLVYVPKGLAEKHLDVFTHIQPYHLNKVGIEICGASLIVPCYAVYLSEVQQVSDREDHPTEKIEDGVCLTTRDEIELWGCMRDVSIALGHSAAITDDVRDGLMQYMSVISAATYRSISLEDRPVAGMLLPKSTTHLRCAYGAPPVGERTVLAAEGMFGLSLHRSMGSMVEYDGPTLGLGGVHTDQFDTVYAQTIGGVTYLLAPLHSVHEQERVLILIRSMIASWNDCISDGGKKDIERITLDASNAATELAALGSSMLLNIDEEEKILVAAIERYKKRLIEMTRLLRVTQQIRAEHRRVIADTPEQRLEEWRKLSALPHVREVYLSEGGMELLTDEVVVESGGQRYRLGTYALRFTKDFMCEVRGVTTHAPCGAMHPHIGRSGSVCFGNMTFAITEALASYDRVRAAELVLSWLVDGYDESSADNPIFMWPIAEDSKQKEEANETIAA